MSKRKPGRPKKVDAKAVAYWRRNNNASITATAKHFGISPRSVAKACAEIAEAQRVYREEIRDREWQALEEAAEHLTSKIRMLKEADQRYENAKAEKGAWSLEARDAFADTMFWANSLIPDDDREKMWR